MSQFMANRIKHANINMNNSSIESAKEEPAASHWFVQLSLHLEIEKYPSSWAREGETIKSVCTHTYTHSINSRQLSFHSPLALSLSLYVPLSSRWSLFPNNRSFSTCVHLSLSVSALVYSVSPSSSSDIYTNCSWGSHTNTQTHTHKILMTTAPCVVAMWSHTFVSLSLKTSHS